MRVAKQTNKQLLDSAITGHRFGGVYALHATICEELLDRRAAMGYVDPTPAEADEAKPTTPRKAMIDRFLDAHSEPPKEDTDATS